MVQPELSPEEIQERIKLMKCENIFLRNFLDGIGNYLAHSFPGYAKNISGFFQGPGFFLQKSDAIFDYGLRAFRQLFKQVFQG